MVSKALVTLLDFSPLPQPAHSGNDLLAGEEHLESSINASLRFRAKHLVMTA